MEAVKARPVPILELKEALNKFLHFKNPEPSKYTPVTYMEAQFVLNTLRYFRDTIGEDPSQNVEARLSETTMENMRSVMEKLPESDNLDLHKMFAREVFEEFMKGEATKPGEAEPGNEEKIFQRSLDHLNHLINVLVNAGDSLEARTRLEKLWKKCPPSFSQLKRARTPWTRIMEGFSREDNEEELLRTFRFAELAGIAFDVRMHLIMVEFYAGKDDVLATKAWFNKKFGERGPLPQCFRIILAFCVRNGEVDWCTSVFRPLVDSNPDKIYWDIIFRWAAGLLDKGVEEVDRMMTIMVRRNPDRPEIRPDIKSINNLVELAHSKRDPYTAERFIALGRKWGIQPNADTLILQMDYRLDIGDLTGAQVAYEQILAEELKSNEDVPVLNKYIQKLCIAKTVKHDLIKLLVSDLEQRKEPLTGDTVIALCLVHLHDYKLQDMINVLQSHSFHLGLQEREKILETFLAICLDRSTDTQKVWDLYTIVRHLFDGEMSTEERTQIMKEFFHRKHPEYAIHVFGHMRQHLMPYKRPTISTYVAAFAGLAQPGCQSAEYLDTLHNMLKLDSSIDPNTQLHNALMLAYTAADDPRRAMDFWNDITNSKEGPTFASIEIAFGACEILLSGDEPAKAIWSKMRRMDIEIIPSVFTAYVGALAGQGLEVEAERLIEGMKADLGFGPNVRT